MKPRMTHEQRRQRVAEILRFLAVNSYEETIAAFPGLSANYIRILAHRHGGKVGMRRNLLGGAGKYFTGWKPIAILADLRDFPDSTYTLISLKHCVTREAVSQIAAVGREFKFLKTPEK